MNSIPEINRSKTALTQKIEAGISIFLASNGFKLIETEVMVAPKWKADLAAVIEPTRTEAQNLKLLPRKPSLHWNLFQKDRQSYNQKKELIQQWEKSYQELPNPLTAMVEIKTSLNDFATDFKFKKKGKLPVNVAFLAIPKGLLAPKHYPPAWFVLECANTGTVIKKSHVGQIHDVSDKRKLQVILRIAMKRDNATQYEYMRRQQKKWRFEDSQRMSVVRMDKAIRIVHGLVTGKYQTVKQALGRHYDGFRPSDYIVKELQEILKYKEIDK